MDTPLKVLLVEDDERDAKLIVRELKQAGYDVNWERVYTAEDFLEQLTPDVDIILSDFTMPQFSGLAALELLKERQPDVPFLLVSGTIGEERAVKAIKEGATDYVLKDRRGRLAEAVTRALREHELRREKQQIEQSLQESEELHRLILSNMADVVFITDESGAFTYISPNVSSVLGYSVDAVNQLENISSLIGITPNDQYLVEEGELHNREVTVSHKDGHTLIMTVTIKRVSMPIGTLLYTLHDVTERKHQESTVRALLQISEKLHTTLDMSELMDLIVQEALPVVKAGGGFAGLSEEGRIATHRYHDQHKSLLFEHTWKENHGVVGWIFEHKQPYVSNDASNDALVISEVRDQFDVHNLIAAPILDDAGHLLGFFEVHNKSNGQPFDEHDKDVLRAISQNAALALQKALLYQELQLYSESLETVVEERTWELVESRRYIETILNSTGEAILVCNQNGRIKTANPAFKQLTGYRLEEVEFRHYSQLVQTPEEQSKFEEAIETALRGETWRGEVRILRYDGSQFDAALTLSPLDNSQAEHKGFVCVMRDITPLKEVARLKDEFVSNVSHELRTPITAIKLNQSMIEMNPEQWKKYSDRIYRETERLNALIEDLLRLSRLDQGRVELKLDRINLVALAQSIVFDRQPLAQANSLQLNFEGQSSELVCVVDKGLIEQVLSILLTNAINYTPEDGIITVATHQQSRDKQQWVGCSVSDTGPGISKQEQTVLFERFHRGEAGNRSGKPGTGLGLAIAKQIIDKHGGHIEVKSEGVAGQGTTFTVWLRGNHVKDQTKGNTSV